MIDIFKKKNEITKNDCLIILSSLLCLSTYAMNVYSVKPLSFGLPISIMDAGLLISWITSILNNIITEVYGEKKARFVVVIAGTFAFAFAVMAKLISYIETLPMYYEQANHFSYIFGNSIRVIIASLIAMLCGNFVKIYVITYLKKKMKTDNNSKFLARTFFSTVLEQLTDNFVFLTLAFAPVSLSLFEISWFDILTIALADTIIEVIIEMILAVPITLNVVNKIKSLN